MEDKNRDGEPESSSESPPKRKRGRPRKNPEASLEQEGVIFNKEILPPSEPVQTDSRVDDSEDEDAVSRMIAAMLKESIDKYGEAADKEFNDQREDFDSLQPIISEFLDDFIIIGHSIDGQRVVMRYTPTPASLDSLTELCKKVLVRMMIEEQGG